ncbi:MAG TPA: lysylphosphatidylglycerol synthase transmembrane domain-containing protein [Propylenella sp.]|nr:lysylphosphatidylglycerol synthase transmembrane domain-containing protein [Propylenella sp.]
MRLKPAPGAPGGKSIRGKRIAGLVSKPALLTAAKALVSASLLLWVIDRVRLSDPSVSLDGGDWRCIALVWLVQSALPVVQAGRWRLIAASLGSRLPFATAVANVYLGQFFNQVLPSSVGGDAARVWKLARLMPIQSALTSVAFDRLVALLAVPFILATGAGILVRLEPPGPFRWTLLAMTGLMACGLLLLLCGDRLPLPIAVSRWKPVEFFRSICRSARQLFSDPGCLARALVLSIVIHVGVGTSLWILAVGNSVDAPLAAFLILAPVITLLSTLPISIGGWGVREGATVAALSLVDVAASDALAISVQFGLVMIVVGLPGGVVALLGAGSRGGGGAAGRGFDQPEPSPAGVLATAPVTRYT